MSKTIDSSSNGVLADGAPRRSLMNDGNSMKELELMKSPTSTKSSSFANEDHISQTLQSDDYLVEQTPLSPQLTIDNSSPISTPVTSPQTKRSLLYNSDDEDEDLGRYSMQFRRTLNGGRYNFHRQERNGYEPIINPARQLFRNIQDARLESRRKRMERLMSLPDNSIRAYVGKFSVCLGSWCDLLEKGLVLFILSVVIFVLILLKLDEDEVLMKRLMLGLGIPFFIVRVAWRPIKYCLCDKRRQGRNNTMENVLDRAISASQHSIIPVV